jgi:hypothetical protein
MSDEKVVDLRFPVAGLHKRYAVQSQSPFSTPDALNVRPTETLAGRERGGSRPGLGKAFYDLLGSGNPVRLLNQVTTVTADDWSFWSDNFKGSSLGAAWSAATWVDASLPSILPGDFADVTYNTARGAVRSALTFDTSLAYEIGLYITPYGGSHNGKYQIFARMNSTPNLTSTGGIKAELIMTDALGTYSGSLKVYDSSGTLTDTHAFTGGGGATTPQAGWFKLRITGNNCVCTWLENTVLASTAVSAAVGSRFGFGMEATVAGGICLVDTFRVQYKTAAGSNVQCRRRRLVASANGSLYSEDQLGKLSAVSTSCTLASDRNLQSAERGQKLYIADNGTPAKIGTNGSTDVAGTLLDDASVTDWTALGINTLDHVVVVLSGVGATAGTYAISTIHATNGLTLASSAGSSATGISYRVERAPKVFDPTAGTLAIIAATAGQVPTGCTVCCLYRDRLFFAGQPIAPHAWFGSRQGTLTDFDYSQTDAARAIAGTTADAGLVGEDITALIPHSDDYMIFGCPNSLWIMRGDPAYGGSLDNLSYSAGIVGKSAWCRGPQGEVIFLARSGLHVIAAGGSGYPQALSRDKLPREMIDIDPTMYTALLEYDQRDRGVHIYLTSAENKGQYHWWFDMQSNSFWPVSLSATHEPTATLAYTSASAEDSAVILGCRDGYIRRYYNSQGSDDGTAFSSYVFYGPIRTGRSDYDEGLVKEIFGALGANSGGVTWSLHVGENHESALNASSFASGTLAAGMNYRFRPRARGASAYLKLTNVDTRPWAVERIGAKIKQSGAQRLA